MCIRDSVMTLAGKDEEQVLQASERLRPALEELVASGCLLYTSRCV